MAYEELTGENVELLNIVMVPENEPVIIFTEKVDDWRETLREKVAKWYKEVKNLTF